MLLQRLLLSLLMVAVVIALPAAATGAPVQQRVTAPIIINGVQVEGATVIDNGVVQSFTCPSPELYVSTDGTSSGLACFDQASGLWLMNAQPQHTANIYAAPSPVYNYYPYPYSYHPYYYGGGFYSAPPLFGFGFGRGHFEHGHFQHRHFEHGHGGFEHGHGEGHGFAHGGRGGHAGGGHMGGGHR